MTLPADDDELAPGTMVGEYRIERAIGAGGMGIVYGAVHPLIGKRSAIKILHAGSSADREGVARFIQEAQAVNKIGHANIVDIFAFGALPDGRAYFVMEWLNGRSLKARIDDSVLPVSEAVTILLALVRAIDAAHAAGVIHRDLKPDNVFLVDDDETFRVKLLDFGIAKLASNQESLTRTATGVTVGTPAYMSPEQARGVDIDARTDLYSLGVVAYEMLCGRTPFEDEASAVEMLHAHLVRPPRPLRELRPEIPGAFEALILALLAKRASDRPTLAEVRHRLATVTASASSVPGAAAAMRTVVSGPRPSRDRPEQDHAPQRRRIRPVVASGLVLAVTGVVGLGAFLALRHDPGADAKAATAWLAPDQLPSPLASTAAAVESPPPASLAPAPIPAPGTPPPLAVVDLTIEPALAAVAIDGEPVVVAHGRVHVTVSPGVHVVSIHASGYRAIEQKLDAGSGAPTELSIHLVHAAPAPVPVPVPVAPSSPSPPAPPPTSDPDGVANPFPRR